MQDKLREALQTIADGELSVDCTAQEYAKNILAEVDAELEAVLAPAGPLGAANPIYWEGYNAAIDEWELKEANREHAVAQAELSAEQLRSEWAGALYENNPTDVWMRFAVRVNAMLRATTPVAQPDTAKPEEPASTIPNDLEPNEFCNRCGYVGQHSANCPSINWWGESSEPAREVPVASTELHTGQVTAAWYHCDGKDCPICAGQAAQPEGMREAAKKLAEACAADFEEPTCEDEEKVSYPEKDCHLTFGHIRNVFRALSTSSARPAPPDLCECGHSIEKDHLSFSNGDKCSKCVCQEIRPAPAGEPVQPARKL